MSVSLVSLYLTFQLPCDRQLSMVKDSMYSWPEELYAGNACRERQLGESYLSKHPHGPGNSKQDRVVTASRAEAEERVASV